MKKGDIVKFVLAHEIRDFGVVICNPYGAVMKINQITTETKVVDVLFGTKIKNKIPIDSLQTIF